MTDVERAFNALKAGGRPVQEFPGWRDRAHPGTFDPWGILFHHDASQFGPSPSVKDWMWINGELAPACHFWVDYDGVWWVGANGLAWHGGAGGGWGVIPAGQANQHSFGVETDHTVGEAWPQKQYDSIVAGFALICREFGFDPHNAVCGHKEYAPDRKVDPDGVDLNRFRSQVANWTPVTKGWDDMATKEEVRAAVESVVREVIAEQIPALLKDASRQWVTRAVLAVAVEGSTAGNDLFTAGAHEDPKVVASVAAHAREPITRAAGKTTTATLAKVADLNTRVDGLAKKVDALSTGGTV